MTFVIDSDKTSDWYIFNPVFMVRVPAEALRTDDEVRVLGTPTTGNRRIDAALSSRMTTTYLNIARMAELAAAGYNVALVNHEDCKTIYDYTQNHLDAWLKLLQHSINRLQAPFEDLQKLDRFASGVFNHARHQYVDQSNIESGFMRSIEELGLLGEFSIFQPSLSKAKAVQAELNNESIAAKRSPLSELFLQVQVGQQR